MPALRRHRLPPPAEPGRLLDFPPPGASIAVDAGTGRVYGAAAVLDLLKRRRDRFGDALTLATHATELEHARLWLGFVHLSKLAARLEAAIAIHELVAREDRAPIDLTAHIDALNRWEP